MNLGRIELPTWRLSVAHSTTELQVLEQLNKIVYCHQYFVFCLQQDLNLQSTEFEAAVSTIPPWRRITLDVYIKGNTNIIISKNMPHCHMYNKKLLLNRIWIKDRGTYDINAI